MSRYELKRVTNAGIFLIALGASGCIHYPETEDFGDAVRHMQTIQTATPGTQAVPQDGIRTREVLRTYREDVGRPQEVRKEITINVGED